LFIFQRHPLYLKSFSNNDDGFRNSWIGYGNALALFLYDDGSIVSIVNPAKIKLMLSTFMIIVSYLVHHNGNLMNLKPSSLLLNDLRYKG